MKHQLIMARALPEEVTGGTLEGDIIPGDITFFRLQGNADSELVSYVAQGEVLPVPTQSFGGIGVFAIPEMARFYRQHYANAHLMLIYDAAHLVDVDRPEAVAEVVGDFLARKERFLVSEQSGVIHP